MVLTSSKTVTMLGAHNVLEDAMHEIPDASVSITVMNHPSLGYGWVYLSAHGAVGPDGRPYRWEQQLPAYRQGEDWSEYLRQALTEVLAAL